MTTVQEIRKELINRGVDQSVVESTKGKANLLKLFATVKRPEVEELEIMDLENLEIEDQKEAEEEAEELPLSQQNISYLSTDWEDFVKSCFLDSELYDGLPTVNGLRRVVETLLGPIIKSSGTVFSTGEEIICNYIVEILWNRDYEGNLGIGDYKPRTFGGTASASKENTDHPYSQYLAANAETRAEVRALRKALRIKTIGVDEVKKEHINDNVKNVVDFENQSISEMQSSLIVSRSDMLKIDVDKLVASIGHKKIKELSKDEASGLIQDLNMYQQNRKEIPESLQITQKEQ